MYEHSTHQYSGFALSSPQCTLNNREDIAQDTSFGAVVVINIVAWYSGLKLPMLRAITCIMIKPYTLCNGHCELCNVH